MMRCSSVSLWACFGIACGGGGGGGGGGGPLGGSAPATTPAVRFLHAAPTLQAVDLCYSVGTANPPQFVGPIMKSAGVSAGLQYGQMTAFRQVDPGFHTIRYVAPGAPDCNTPLFNFGTSEPFFNNMNGPAWTITITSAGPTPGHRSDSDPVGQATAGQVALAFRNFMVVTPQVQVDLLLAATVSGMTVLGTVFDHVGSPVEKGTYTPTGARIEVRPTGMATALVAGSISLVDKGMFSAFVLGTPGSATAPPKLLVCENASSTTAFGNCLTLP